MAERAVLRDNHRDEVVARRRVVQAHFASLLAAAEQRIIAHIKAKIIAIDPTLSLDERLAAVARLASEQADALSQLRVEMRHQKRRALHATRGVGHTRFKRTRRAFTDRHIVERAEIYALLGIRPARRLLPYIAFDATLDLVAHMTTSTPTHSLKQQARISHSPKR